MVIRVGTRPSPLALKQVREIRSLLESVDFVIVSIKTQGDKDKITSLSDTDSSFFTKEIDQALLNEEIDMAIHSSKDLPDILPKGLVVFFESKPISRYDALVSRNNFKLQELPTGSRIGASSQRRKDAILTLRPDLKIIDIRGNIEERLGLIEKDKIDALIVAEAALIRLGLENMISETFSLDIFKTHPKQGSLSVVVREDKCQKLRSILSELGPGIGN